MESFKSNKHKLSTRKNYHGIWKNFNEFVIKLDVIPKKWEHKLELYCTHLIKSGLQSSTLRSYVSAIRQTLITDGYHWDNKLFILSSFVHVCKMENDRVITRLPIQIGLLDLILFETANIFRQQYYLEVLYKTVFLLAYYGLLRISEIAGEHALQARDVHLCKKHKKILMLLRSSKTHGPGQRPQQIRISQQEHLQFTKIRPAVHFFSPFDTVFEYSQLRRKYRQDKEHFFIFSGGKPIQPCNVRTTLRQILTNLKLEANLYDTHSFRIGRATDLMRNGTSFETIKQKGRWKSDAIYAYLR